MEFQAFVHGVIASAQPAAGEEAGLAHSSNFTSTAFKSALTAKISFYTTIAVAAVIGSLTSLPVFAAEHITSTTNVQSLLANKGFYGGEIDGIEGNSTRQAIVKAQRFYGLNTDGVVGRATLVALQEDKVDALAVPTISANISVSDLQALLAKRGFYKGAVDGVPGPSTKAAVVQAQKFYGLTPDGIAGNRTVEALEADKDAPQVASSLTADDITKLQKLLASRGFYNGPISGFIGDLTKGAIRKAQKFYGLTEDGVPGKATFAALEADSEYKKSAKTEEIKNVQSLLTERGFYKGEIDGVLGEGTKEAIRAAQKSYGLKVDGVAGAETLSALNSNKTRRVSTDRTTTKTAVARRPAPVIEKRAAKPTEKTVEKTAAKPSSTTKTAVKPAPAKTEVATKPVAKPATIAASPVTVKPNPTKPTATKPVTAEATKTAAKPAPTAEHNTAAKPIATQATTTKPISSNPEATKPAEASTPSAAKPVVVSPSSRETITTKPAPEVTTPAASPASTQAAKPAASKNAQVSQLQNLLATRGFFTGSSTGMLDSETKNAIVRAQSFYGLTPADGDPSPALVDSLSRDPFVAKDN